MKKLRLILVMALAMQSVLVCDAKSLFQRGAYLSNQARQAAAKFYTTMRNIGLTDEERIAAQSQQELVQQAKELEKIYQKAERLQGARKWEYLTGAAKRIVVGILAVAALLALALSLDISDIGNMPVSPIFILIAVIGAFGISIAWPTAFMLKKAGINAYHRNNINNVLAKYTEYSDINKLNLAQAALIVAAYKGNLALVTQLSKQLPEFVAQSGVLEAVAVLLEKKKALKRDKNEVEIIA